MLGQLKYLIDCLRNTRDGLRRWVSIKLFDTAHQNSGKFVDSVVFVRWDAKLGDTVVLSWVWRELILQRPDLKIVVITSTGFTTLLKTSYGIDALYHADKRGGWLALYRLAKRLQHPRFVVHLSPKMKARDLLFLRWLKPQYVVGLDDDLSIVNIKLGCATRLSHFSEKLSPWLSSIGVNTSNRTYWLPNDPKLGQSVRGDWPSDGVIGLCPFGASSQRRLSLERITQIVCWLIEHTSAHVLLFVQPNQINRLRWQLESRGCGHRILFRPTHDIGELIELVRACSAMVSVDTALVHLAVGLNKPLLAIYNPAASPNINYCWWHPNAQNAVSIFAEPSIPQRIDAVSQVQLAQGLAKMVHFMKSNTDPSSL